MLQSDMIELNLLPKFSSQVVLFHLQKKKKKSSIISIKNFDFDQPLSLDFIKKLGNNFSIAREGHNLMNAWTKQGHARPLV